MCTEYQIIAKIYSIYGMTVKLSPILMHALQLTTDRIRNCPEKFSVVREDELMLCRGHWNINVHVHCAELHKRRQFFFTALHFSRAAMKPVRGFFIPFVVGWSYVWARPRPVKTPFFPLGDRQINRNTEHWQTRNKELDLTPVCDILCTRNLFWNPLGSEPRSSRRKACKY